MISEYIENSPKLISIKNLALTFCPISMKVMVGMRLLIKFEGKIMKISYLSTSQKYWRKKISVRLTKSPSFNHVALTRKNSCGIDPT